MPYANKEKQSEYNKNFQLNNYDRLGIRVEKGRKDKLLEVAKQNGVSLNEFVNNAINEKLASLGIEV